MAGLGKLAVQGAKKPDGGAYLKSPMPLASVFPPAVISPAKLES